MTKSADPDQLASSVGYNKINHFFFISPELNKVIYSSSPINLLNIKASAKILSEISCTKGKV